MTLVRNARTDCEGIVNCWVLIAPPPYLKVAALMTAIAAALDPDAAPHAGRERRRGRLRR